MRHFQRSGTGQDWYALVVLHCEASRSVGQISWDKLQPRFLLSSSCLLLDSLLPRMKKCWTKYLLFLHLKSLLFLLPFLHLPSLTATLTLALPCPKKPLQGRGKEAIEVEGGHQFWSRVGALLFTLTSTGFTEKKNLLRHNKLCGHNERASNLTTFKKRMIEDSEQFK